MIAVLVLGPPASGKTTAVRTLVEPPSGIAHFKVRDHFAHLLATGDPVAVAHREQLRRRAVLPDAVVRHAFADFLDAHAAAEVVLVEGYPKSAAQLADMRGALASHGGRVAGAVIFDAPDPVLHARRAHRLVCPVCDQSGIRGQDTSCPRCRVGLVDRPDDELDRFAGRVAQFRTAGSEVAHLLGDAGSVVLDADLPPDALADRLRTTVRRFLRPEATSVVTEVFFGARSTGWDGVRPVADLGVPLHVDVHGLARGNLFLVTDDRPADLAARRSTFAAATAQLTKLVRDKEPAVTEVVPIGAIQRDPAGEPTAFRPATVGADLIFSRCAERVPAHALLAYEDHVLLEVDLTKRAEDDLTFIEREMKLDADADPRPAAQRLRFGDGVAVFSGTPAPNVHFHRIYDIGPSGLFEMTSDPDGGPTLLKHKKDLGSPGDPVYRRLEAVEPTTPESIRRVMAELDPSAEPSQVPVTPYFQRDRVRTNVYFAGSRSVYVLYADHSVFLNGDHTPFTQVEIEYVGVVDRAGAQVSWGPAAVPRLDSEFATIEALVIDGYARAGITLAPSRRRKYDWAVTEVFAPRADHADHADPAVTGSPSRSPGTGSAR